LSSSGRIEQRGWLEWRHLARLSLPLLLLRLL
jgi:hypothetical protein